MKHAVVVAHPNPESLTRSAAKAYADAARALGHEVTVRDLYAMDFDPRLQAAEIPKPTGVRAPPEVAAERSELADVDVFAFIYPFWFNAPPAILKGYVDRVFGMGFGFGPAPGGTEPLLEGRKLISFSFSGAPQEWVQDTGALKALMTVFDSHICAMCGLELLDHVHTGGIVPDMTQEAAAEVLDGVRARVDAVFRPDAVRSVFDLAPGL